MRGSPNLEGDFAGEIGSKKKRVAVRSTESPSMRMDPPVFVTVTARSQTSTNRQHQAARMKAVDDNNTGLPSVRLRLEE